MAAPSENVLPVPVSSGGFAAWLRARLTSREERLRELHHRVFALFAPDSACMPAEQRDELPRAEQNAWQVVRDTPDVQTLLSLLDRLHALTSGSLLWFYHRLLIKTPMESLAVRRRAYASVRAFLDRIQTASGERARSLADLDRDQARELIDLLLQSPLGFHRRLACGLRIFYIRCLYYGRMGRMVAGIAGTDNHRDDPAARLLEADPQIRLPDFQSPLRYDARTQTLEGTIDTLIVGAGPAGCTVAHELQAAGQCVLVLESGPFFMPGTYDGRAGLDFYESRGFRSTMDGGIFVLNGAVVGGGATVNVDMAFSPELASVRHRFEQWRAQRQIPEDFWTPDELSRAHAWMAEQLNTRQVGAAEINRHNRILYDGALAHGREPSLYRLNTHAAGQSPYARTDKCGPVETLLMPALLDVRNGGCNPTTLVPNAAVQRVLFDDDQAVGVEFVVTPHAPRAGLVADPFRLNLPPRTRICARARRIVLAAGTLGSSAILLASGVRNARVGRGLVMHPFMLAFGLFDEDVSCHVGTPSSVFVGDYLATTARAQPHADFLIESASARPEIGALLLPGNGDQVYRTISQYRRLGGLGILLIDSVDSNNRIKIDRRGRPEVHYTLPQADKQRFRFGMAEGMRILCKAGARKVLLPTHERLPVLGAGAGELPFISGAEHADRVAQALEFTPNRTPLFGAHIMAGNKLAADPQRGVVSPDHHVWGTKNLYVVDGSVFPGSVGANPMQTIYTIAKLFSDRHLARHG
jgi:choline dehydrogenase-like flavoprotein